MAEMANEEKEGIIGKKELFNLIIECFNCIANDLFSKYILVGSDFEVNISGLERNKLEKAIDSITAKLLKPIAIENNKELQLQMETFYNLFDSEIAEMFHLMHHSFVRFINTEVSVFFEYFFLLYYSNFPNYK